MIKTVTDKKDYIKKCDVEDFNISKHYYDKKVQLFGKDVYLNSDPWLWHLHLKCTDKCNGKCDFCVEQGCPINEDANDFLDSTDRMLHEMNNAGCLNSVSVTGGEPLLFSKLDTLVDILKSYPIQFLTMNTNGTYLKEHLDLIDGTFDYVDISRHAIDDNDNEQIFKTKVPSKEELQYIKNQLQKTKMRIQCVMYKVKSIDDMNKFIKAFNFADDLSFRRLMKLSDEYGVNYKIGEDDYDKILDYAYNNFDFIQQTIQDYYVYEIWKAFGVDITYSYSNMSMLRDKEKKESEDVFREFIVHPDGLVSGSWKKDNKILRNVKNKIH